MSNEASGARPAFTRVVPKERMFCSVQYGISGSAEENYFNVNCGTAAFKDFIQERALGTVMEVLEKQKEQQRRAVSMLTRQINAHTRHIGNLQKRGAPLAEPPEGDPNPLESIGTINTWIEAAQREMKQREEILVILDKHEAEMAQITGIDLQEPGSGQFVNLSSFPTNMPASAALALRSSTVLYGLRESEDPISLVLNIPPLERSPQVEEMITKGLLQRKH